jgi:uncharacterized protein (TIGR03066 family)
MKSKTHNAKSLVRQNQRSPKTPGSAVLGQRRFLGLPRWVFILLLVALAAGASFVAFELLLPGRIPAELVGHWRVVGGQMDGTIFEFQRNGAMIGRKSLGDKDGLIEGTAEVSGNTLRTTTKNPFSGRAETGTQTIVLLNDTELVTEDRQGTRIAMVRAVR